MSVDNGGRGLISIHRHVMEFVETFNRQHCLVFVDSLIQDASIFFDVCPDDDESLTGREFYLTQYLRRMAPWIDIDNDYYMGTGEKHPIFSSDYIPNAPLDYGYPLCNIMRRHILGKNIIFSVTNGKPDFLSSDHILYYDHDIVNNDDQTASFVIKIIA